MRREEVQETISAARDAMTARRVHGEPYERDGVTLIPAAAVAGTAGGGGGEDPEKGATGAGGGFGLAARPVGAYVIESGRARWLPAPDVTRIALGALIVGAALALWLLRRESSSREEARTPRAARHRKHAWAQTRRRAMANGHLDEPLRPWAVSEADYPAGAGDGERIRFLLRYAILAPSGHNTQPWLFSLGGDELELRADRTRALTVVDPYDRALVISCGTALATLAVAARRFGERAALAILPDPHDEDLLARVTLEDAGPPSDDERALFEAIPARRSNRQAFEDRDLPGELVAGLVAEAAAEGVWLHPIRGDERAAIADLVAEGDRAQMADRRFRRELAAWIHPNRSRSRDGMRGYGFGFGAVMSHAGPLVIRSFDLGRGVAAKDRELAQGAPLLAVLGTDSDDPAAWLASGQALQRVLLRARAAGVWSSFLNQPIEVAELRPRLAEAIGRAGRHPQLLLRLGYGPPVRPEPRRAVEEVLVEGDARKP